MLHVEHRDIIPCELHADLRMTAHMQNATIFPYMDQLTVEPGQQSQAEQIYNLMVKNGIRVKLAIEALKAAPTDGAKFDFSKSLKKYACTGN